ncbi:V-type ATP synthase subunit F [Marispirochaeta sp.]|jgi:V/A-type H+/Na+-transporting ATPase subunit F|uniref:V-type ATP synthase subunit F n=1 Tax=Marispirochaeta sp. TaxID=2038653 RepID=UPI0029C7F4CE|nr:V-type ATP synthase subunit F [Marispirochaeta sp.]
MNYFLIGDEDAVLGFAMVGVPGRIAGTAAEAGQAFNDAVSSGDAGIIIITEDTADMIRDRIDRYIFSEHFPLIVEIPGRGGRDSKRPSLREMVNKAIGINLS